MRASFFGLAIFVVNEAAPNTALELANAGDFGSGWRATRASRIHPMRLQLNATRYAASTGREREHV